MSIGPLVTEIVVTFIVAASLLYRYGNWFKHHIIVTLSVLIAWYFSFLIIFVLPLDVSSTVYRQCVQSHNDTTTPSFLTEHSNGSSANDTAENSCQIPWSYVGDSVFPNLWRVVYWTSQCLTWLILPLMQSYTKAGDFSIRGKLRSSLIDNAIYYSTYLFICGILLIYIALKPGLDLDGQKLKAIASSASNTWGLFLLVLLLGHALVEIPRSIWRASSCLHSLSRAYFRTAKLSSEMSEAEEGLDDMLEALSAAALSISPGHYLHANLETIMQLIPFELRERMHRRPLADDACPEEPTERSLVRLHKQVKKALQMQHRTQAQWEILMDDVIALEEATRSMTSHVRAPVWPPNQSWYWKGREWGLKTVAVCAGVLSACVVWSEVTFFNKEPVLSIFARIVNLAKLEYDYFTIEIISTLVIAYLCFCAYSTVFKIRVLNFYYLAGHHGTDEYSLIFSGMMLCRLTPPMCLNFLGLIHMDSHVIKTHMLETYYTQVMGHMDVIAIISDGFNIYFPMLLLLLCVFTYFSLGARLLSALGFQQFVSGEDEMTADLVDEGRNLVKREKRRRQRNEETSNRRREFQERFGTLGLRRTRGEDRVRQEDNSLESARAVLLRDVEPLDYSSSQPTMSPHQLVDIPTIPERTGMGHHQLPRGLFDDI